MHIPILKYVDDFFSALRAAEAGAGARVCFRARARSFAQAEHALGCLVRLVRALLGPSALAEHKRECGNPLVILGLRIKLSPAGMRATPSDDKAKKWLCRIAEAIRADKLTAGVKGPALVPRRRARRCAGEASKLAGALSWGASHQFRRVGRAMVRPLFQHAHGYGKRLSGNVRDSLSWWHEVPSSRVVEQRKFKASAQAPV